MPVVRIPNAGGIGIIKDLYQSELPQNAWTDGRNFRALDSRMQMFYGYGQVYDTPSIEPYYLMPVYTNGTRYWIVAGLNKIYAVTITGGAAVWTNITRQTAGNDVNYAATVNSWTGTLIGGIPVLNNGVDPPQYWDLNIANNCAILSNWPGATTLCKSMRGFKNFLVALNVNEGGTQYPFMVRTSHPAVPGALPTSWDYTDNTKDTLRFDLAKGYDPIVDGYPLRDALIIYKEASIWRVDYVGGQFVDNFTQVLGTSGAMNVNCVAELDGFHAVLTNSDIILHDGQSARSILDKQMRRYVFQNIDVDNQAACFVFKNHFFNEVLFCFPKAGSTKCDLAVVYNWVDKTCSLRDLPNANCGEYGPVDTSLSGTWDSDSAPWESDLSLWNGPDFVPPNARTLIGISGPKLHWLDGTADYDGSVPTAYLERRGLHLDLPEREKLVTAIRPRITGTPGTVVNIYVGSADTVDGDVTYCDAMPFTIGTTVELDCIVHGRYIATKFANSTAYEMALHGYEVDVKPTGRF